MKSFWQNLTELLKGHHAGQTGALIGLSLGLLLVIFGFWKTLFVLLLAGAGYYLGNRYFAHPEDFRNLLDKILPPGKFR